MTRPALEVVGVRQRYGRTTALDGVNLTIDPGELLGLLGPNGAGKTTLLGILAGLTDPTEGTVRLFGDPFGTRDRGLRRLVGLATQDLAVYPELTAGENLHFFGSLYGLSGPELRARVRELLEAVGLADRSDHRAGTFSGGMKRRLNLAAALVHHPRLLLLDEPTAGVDPQSRNHIFRLVRQLNADGLTVVYTSHYMEEVQALCQRIAILDSGRVMACDTLPNLLRLMGSTARFRFGHAPQGLAERLGGLPGVTAAVTNSDGFAVTAADLAPVLPGVLRACAELGVEPIAIEVEQPNLERVFLHLTGHELRD